MAVSTVLHGAGQNVRVSEETAGKIRKAASDLNYQPNSLARSLRFRTTSTVGVVFQHFERLCEDNPYYPQMLNGVMAALFESNYTLALCPKLVQGDDSGAIGDGRFDGVLWARPDFTEASVEKLRRSNIPLVMMHAPPGSAPGVSTFCVDNDGALRMVLNYLVELGHENFTFVVDEINEHTAEGRARAQAFMSATRERNVYGEIWVWNEQPKALDSYRVRHRNQTAMVVFSDTLAGQLLTACDSLGILVPRDISVVGFDSSSFCERTRPKLTSVFQPVEQIAYEATAHLLDLIKEKRAGSDPATPVSSLYDCGLDVRESTSSPSSWKKTL